MQLLAPIEFLMPVLEDPNDLHVLLQCILLLFYYSLLCCLTILGINFSHFFPFSIPRRLAPCCVVMWTVTVQSRLTVVILFGFAVFLWLLSWIWAFFFPLSFFFLFRKFFLFILNPEVYRALNLLAKNSCVCAHKSTGIPSNYFAWQKCFHVPCYGWVRRGQVSGGVGWAQYSRFQVWDLWFMHLSPLILEKCNSGFVFCISKTISD